MTDESPDTIRSSARQVERNAISALLAHYTMYENAGLDIAALPRPVAECIAMTDPAALRGITRAAAQRLVELDGLDTEHRGRGPASPWPIGHPAHPVESERGVQGRPSIGPEHSRPASSAWGLES